MNRLPLKWYIKMLNKLFQSKKVLNLEGSLSAVQNIKIKCVCTKPVTIEPTHQVICAWVICNSFRWKISLVISILMASLDWLLTITRGLISISCLNKIKLRIFKLVWTSKTLMTNKAKVWFPLVTSIIPMLKEGKMVLITILTLVLTTGLCSWTIYNLVMLISVELAVVRWH